MTCLGLLLLGRCTNLIDSPAVFSSFHAVAAQFCGPAILPPETVRPWFKTILQDGENSFFGMSGAFWPWKTEASARTAPPSRTSVPKNA